MASTVNVFGTDAVVLNARAIGDRISLHERSERVHDDNVEIEVCFRVEGPIGPDDPPWGPMNEQWVPLNSISGHVAYNWKMGHGEFVVRL
jgi:hypothetical protein